ncbi:hypothetical protein B586_15965 [Mycobacterium haemophilum DSM 44634]|nr:hypothetical protein B586_15965 [Mycobacterium haemophilum DSM 44634]
MVFGLPGVRVVGVERYGDGTRVVDVVAEEQSAAVCLSRGVVSMSVKDYVVTSPKDPLQGRPYHGALEQSSLAMPGRLLQTGSFTEAITQVPARARSTLRLRVQMAKVVGDAARSVAEVAAAHGVWWPTETARSTQWVNLRLLLNARERLSDKSVTKMWDRISATDPTAQSLSAWIAKEELRILLSTVRDGGDAHRLHRILAWCIDLQIPELLTLTRSSSLFLGSVRIGNMCIL